MASNVAVNTATELSLDMIVQLAYMTILSLPIGRDKIVILQPDGLKRCCSQRKVIPIVAMRTAPSNVDIFLKM